MKITQKLVSEVKRKNRLSFHDRLWHDFMSIPEVKSINAAIEQEKHNHPTNSDIVDVAKKFLFVFKDDRATNPRPRIGTKRTKRDSERPHGVGKGKTSKSPTARLIKRRKANTEEGYFPNPAFIKNPSHAKINDLKYEVMASGDGKKWEIVAVFRDPKEAVKYAEWLSKREPSFHIKVDAQ